MNDGSLDQFVRYSMPTDYQSIGKDGVLNFKEAKIVPYFLIRDISVYDKIKYEKYDFSFFALLGGQHCLITSLMALWAQSREPRQSANFSMLLCQLQSK